MGETLVIFSCPRLSLLPTLFSHCACERTRFQTPGSAACLLSDLRPLNFSEIVSFHPCSSQDFESEIMQGCHSFLYGEEWIENTFVCLNRLFPLYPRGSPRRENELRPSLCLCPTTHCWPESE